ncbi:hypothetical protein L9W92_17920 [Pelotomaculum terephthalicicum JT]|uniref:hypothetical protein n=1 Tax=Pelotomaculum TaxID=191373 RepID=UPI0009C814B8|nr:MULTISPECIES: hypothetical protein [Pelotomaculum]MCG9969877.1 hypothetical protein [Pelotomaculum terephthalicicum JT]OPX87262.1 MAG: hypothetical protein A4E54_01758 [Pelotomaculum sp. PtaB.Bin117]OPY60367.1 MAG: hypothetical protein A4E56_02733 [Pelotomaculum sp. PtaU1.Bin065]
MLDKYVLPKRVYISSHATEMYLSRILGKPATKRNFQTARLFLSHMLSNRVCHFIESRRDEAAFRLKLAFCGIIFIYEPQCNEVYTIYPDKKSKERFEMCMRIPADFTVSEQVKSIMGKRIWGKLFRYEWPVVTAKAKPNRPTSILRIKAGNWLIDLDMVEREVSGALIFGCSSKDYDEESNK